VHMKVLMGLVTDHARMRMPSLPLHREVSAGCEQVSCIGVESNRVHASGVLLSGTCCAQIVENRDHELQGAGLLEGVWSGSARGVGGDRSA